MEMENTIKPSNRNALISIGIAVVLLGAGALVLFRDSENPLPIAEDDTLASWNVSGPYRDGGELEKRVTDEIARLTSLLGGDQSGENDDPTDYTLYVSIANQYKLLGDGKGAYENLSRALRIDSTKTGLAWRNIGDLMETLGAYNTARIAYAKAVEVQPQVSEYHIVRLKLLVHHFSEDSSVIESAFKEAENQFGDISEILQLRVEWYRDTGRLEEAISVLQKIKSLSGGGDEIDKEIAKLRAQI